MNWIHPFFGGNGRTTRAVSYLALSAKLGFVIPGSPSIPELIDTEYRTAYYAGLRSADAAFAAGMVNVEGMQGVIESALAQQLVNVHSKATGKAALEK